LGVWSYIAKRAALSTVVVLTVALLAVVLVRLAPGDPAELLAGEGASVEYVKMIRAEYGLDRPLTEQLAIYFRNLLMGNLGFSISFSRPVIDVIMERVPQTLLLAGTAIFFAVVIGIVLGISAAKKPYSLRDGLINGISLTLFSIPVFWLGMVLIFGLSLRVRLFPTGGLFDVGVEGNLPNLVVNVGWHLVLPALTLCSYFLATYARLTRAGLLEALGMNYIVAARAKGVSEHDVLYRHALRNALLPVITIAGIQIGLMVGGVVLTEGVFSWPGVGSLLIMAVSYRDYPLVTGIFFITAISVAVSNLVADMVYAMVDPRIRTGIA